MEQIRLPRTMLHDDPRRMLTEAQLACVRLVGRGPSKVIAKILGLSPHTVDNHLKAAMQRLGAATRHEAAEIVSRWDAMRDGVDSTHDQDLVSQSRGLVPAAKPDIFGEPWRSPTADGGADRVREMPVPFGGFGEVDAAPLSSVREDKPDARSPLRIIASIIAITLAIVIIASAALPISNGFQALSNLIEPYRHK